MKVGNLALKSWFFLLLVSLTLIIGLYHFGDRQGLLFGFLISLVLNTLAYFYSSAIVKSQVPAQFIEGRDPWRLLNLVEVMAKKAQIGVPKIYLLPFRTPSSFSLARSPAHGSIFLTNGLLQLLSQEELSAILAYEMAHIKTQASLSFAMGGFLALSILGISKSVREILSFLGDRLSAKIEFGLNIFLFPIALALVRACVSRKSYSICDQLAAKWIGNPQLLAEVLWKLHSYSLTLPLAAHPGMAHLFIVSPLTTSKWYRYFSLQPSVERRIKNLVGTFPI